MSFILTQSIPSGYWGNSGFMLGKTLSHAWIRSREKYLCYPPKFLLLPKQDWHAPALSYRVSFFEELQGVLLLVDKKMYFSPIGIAVEVGKINHKAPPAIVDVPDFSAGNTLRSCFPRPPYCGATWDSCPVSKGALKCSLRCE
jgi:hypothetical protein